MDVAQELRELEETLWDPVTRYDPEHLETVLADEFVEFGRSGRIWDRHEIVTSTPEPFLATLPLPGFQVRLISDDVALATYRSEVHHEADIVVANRSSVWRRSQSGWKLVFHQGTPT